ncbi:hypothetical protein GTQ43_31665 [Nostoc sp. KVJ3]|nr:hypothetical protein [Nostoc sp. KVJ3]
MIRIDRVQDGKIAEHWSVSDAAGLNTSRLRLKLL